MDTLLGECLGMEESIAASGYAPYVQCAREAASSCEPNDCLNLYYDVRQHCYGGAEGQRCGFPRPASQPDACTQALARMLENADSCTGLPVSAQSFSPDSFYQAHSGEAVLGVSREVSNVPQQTFPMVHAEVSASCLGCDASALFRACGRPGPNGWETCSVECGTFALPFLTNFRTNPVCTSLWDSAGITYDSAPPDHDHPHMVMVSGIMDQLYDLCAVDCSGVRAPYEGDWGTCPPSGTLPAGQSCELACDDSSAELHGTQPFCAPGGHLMAAGSTSQPWEAGSCGCPHGQYNHVVGASSSCRPCTPCRPDQIERMECGYQVSNGERIFTGEPDTVCESCELEGEFRASRYADPHTRRCEECSRCPPGHPEVRQCTHERDTGCGYPCPGGLISAPADGDLGTCADAATNGLASGEACELRCNGVVVGSQPECGADGQLVRAGTDTPWTDGDLTCAPCADEPGQIVFNHFTCAQYAAQPGACNQNVPGLGILRDHCMLSCRVGSCGAPPPPPPAVPGCTDPTALNYDEAATQDDGTCEAFEIAPLPPPPPPPPTGCAAGQQPEHASNPCPELTVGRRCFFECEDGYRVAGQHTCNADGTVTGGTCEREPPPPPPPPPPAVLGCTEPAALNYNEAATQDDGSCETAPPSLPESEPCGPEQLPCQNGGSCNSVGRRESCRCLSGFQGHQCEVNLDECAAAAHGNPCQHGGSCVDGIDQYTCSCIDGYTGGDCEVPPPLPPPPPPPPPDPCDSLCLNGGECSTIGSRPVCRCQAGFGGDTCQENLDPCAAEPCLNGGACTTVGVDEFRCECMPGGDTCFSGTTCAESNPCARPPPPPANPPPPSEPPPPPVSNSLLSPSI